jgi:hypothetical protein
VVLIIAIVMAHLLYHDSMNESLVSIRGNVLQATEWHLYQGLHGPISFAATIITSIAAFFSPPSVFPLGITGAPNITQVLIKAHIAAGTGELLALYLGTPDGVIISCEFPSTQSTPLLIYTQSTELSPAPMSRWESDDLGINTSYPFDGGTVIGGSYFVTTRPFYQKALAFNQSTWTEIYFGQAALHDIPMITGSAPVWDPEVGAFTAALGATIPIDVIQNLLETAVPSENSRLAIADTTGYLLAVTGTDPPIDVYRGTIVTKRIAFVQDPIWRGIVSSPEWSTTSNFTITLEIGGQALEFGLSRWNFSSAQHDTWTFYSVLCLSELYSQDADLPISVLLLPIGVVVFAVALLALFSAGRARAILENQSRWAIGRGGSAENGLEPTGLLPAVEMLTRLLKSHGDSPERRRMLMQALAELNPVSEYQFFWSDGRQRGEMDPEILNRLLEIYGGDAVVETGERETVDLLVGKTRDFSLWRDVFGMGDVPFELIWDRIVSDGPIMAIFDEGELNRVVEELFEQIPATCHRLLLDSLEFLQIALQATLRPLLPQSHPAFELAPQLAVFIWHFAHDRGGNRNTEHMADRYFVTDWNELFEVTGVVLGAIFRTLRNPLEPLWVELEGMIMAFLVSLPLERHVKAMRSFHLVRRSLSPDLVYTMREGIIVMRVVTIAATVSFMFHDPLTSRSFHLLTRRESEDVENSTTKSGISHTSSRFLSTDSGAHGNFSHCLATEYLTPLRGCLENLFGLRIMKQFSERFPSAFVYSEDCN